MNRVISITINTQQLAMLLVNSECHFALKIKMWGVDIAVLRLLHTLYASCLNSFFCGAWHLPVAKLWICHWLYCRPQVTQCICILCFKVSSELYM